MTICTNILIVLPNNRTKNDKIEKNILVLPSILSKNSNNSTIPYPIDVINISKSSRIEPQYNNNNKYLTCMTDIY